MESIFSKNLKAYLQIHNETYFELADIVGVTKSCISNWINGVSIPKMDKIQIIAKHFNTTPENLLYRDLDAQLREVFLENKEKTSIETELLIDFRNLNDKGQNYVLESIDLAKRKYNKTI